MLGAENKPQVNEEIDQERDPDSGYFQRPLADIGDAFPHLFQERQVRSVSSNTRADAREFLALAERHHIALTTPEYPLSRADRALSDLAAGRISGAAVLMVG